MADAPRILQVVQNGLRKRAAAGTIPMHRDPVNGYRPFRRFEHSQSRLGNRMTETAKCNIEDLETDLWAAADNLRANSKLTSSEYCMPVLGVIFLRHATNRYEAAAAQIAADQAAGKMP